jgi:hypothetical protein
VLQDPSLIHPSTGLPLNGNLEHGILVSSEQFSLAAGDTDSRANTHKALLGRA